MFKLFVFLALVACAVAAPGLVGAPVAYAGVPVAAPLAAPIAAAPLAYGAYGAYAHAPLAYSAPLGLRTAIYG
ncbi:hypothetical protein R5R35_014777 [Gryllus longicercus]|uniref:Neuropeptide-like 4 n=1 Tax=Gryllus longicercus TaxID=2509291 RepID=A0AAN9V5J9_9ORTH|nr:Protein of unknown function [Gryllus bimaculatus]